MNADKTSNLETADGAIAMAKAEANALRSVSTEGCTKKQQAEIKIMADERQVQVDLGQRLKDIQSGKINVVSKEDELARADKMVAATASYQTRFNALVERLRSLAGAPAT
jgi:hypothetical protein